MSVQDARAARDLRRDYWYKIRSEPRALQRFVARRLFPLFERAGLHVTADHFYEIIPNTRQVRSSYDRNARPCLGIVFKPEEAERHLLDLLGRWSSDFYTEAGQEGYYEGNSYFRGVDALTLYCVLRELKPKRVIEIGHGFSTRVILTSLRKNSGETGQKPQLLSVDPFARFIPTAAASAAVEFEICSRPLQEAVDLVVGNLTAGDFLFVDSTHVFKSGSDVELYFDQIYPRLPAGVHVHVHDVFSPYDYPLDWICDQRRFWNEQYHLENFLRFNNLFEITIPLHMLLRQSELVQNAFRDRIDGDHSDLFLGQSLYLRTN